ncbi:MAG TPA: NAD(P)-dependent oxidoreductase [Longimicrobiales bacterium]
MTGFEATAYRGARALVVGATGFIGQRVASLLDRSGARVTATGRDPAALAALRRRLSARGETVVCDVGSADEVTRLLRRTQPAITFNLAGYGVDRTERDEAAAHRINAELPALLVRQLSQAGRGGWSGQVLVHAGSALEYGEARGDLDEDTVPVATTLYGRTKLAGTQAVTEQSAQGLAALTARLFTVYGPGEHAGRLLPSLLETAHRGVPLDLTAGTQLRDFTYVDDVAEGMLRLGTSPPGAPAVVNLATGRLESVRGFTERAARVLGIDSALLRFGALPARGEEMSHDPVSVRRLRELTGWVPRTTIEEGVRRTVTEVDGGETGEPSSEPGVRAGQ